LGICVFLNQLENTMKKILIVDDKETIAYLQESNRPRPMYKGELLTNDEYIDRFLAPAGLTGLWQVSKRGF